MPYPGLQLLPITVTLNAKKKSSPPRRVTSKGDWCDIYLIFSLFLLPICMPNSLLIGVFLISLITPIHSWFSWISIEIFSKMWKSSLEACTFPSHHTLFRVGHWTYIQNAISKLGTLITCLRSNALWEILVSFPPFDMHREGM